MGQTTGSSAHRRKRPNPPIEPISLKFLSDVLRCLPARLHNSTNDGLDTIGKDLADSDEARKKV